MTLEERLRASVDLKYLKLPEKTPVVSICAKEYFDWAGDDAVRVDIVFKASFKLTPANLKMVCELKDSIRQSLRDHGVELFPYIFISLAKRVRRKPGDSKPA